MHEQIRRSKKRLIALAWVVQLLCCSSLLQAAESVSGENDERAIDRSLFGVAGQPSWSPLTSFELEVMSQFTTVEAVAPDDLLALYLIASGDVRDAGQYLYYKNIIDEFWVAHPALSRISDERERGAALLRAMHAHFFYPDQPSSRDSHYHEDQSALSVLLRSRIYNCISSALLYIVLAEQAGLHASGVIMPSHAFVQLGLSDGARIEVETTSADGFDVIRDQNFFAEQAGDWFAERRLVVASYADYELRSIVSAVQLGLENMWSQHVSVDRMDYANRLRMSEIKGLLQADQPDAQHNRAVYYYREADFLRRQADEARLHTLMARIDEFLADHESAGYFRTETYTDEDTLLPLALLQAIRAEWLIRQGNAGPGLALAHQVIQLLPSDTTDRDVVLETAYSAIGVYMDQQIAAGRFDAAREALAGLEPVCSRYQYCINALEQYYMSFAQHYWSQKNWTRVISIYDEYLRLALDTENRRVFQQNLESAYLNQVEQFWFDEERDEALNLLEVCIIRSEVAERCAERLATIRR